MSYGRYSRLQAKLCTAINQVAEHYHLGYAFPSLHCAIAGRVIVFDLAVFRTSRIPCQSNGEIVNQIELAPDWAIAMLAPDRKPNHMIDELRHCLKQGTELAWFMDLEDRSILLLLPGQSPELLQGSDRVQCLADLPLHLTVAEIFAWLTLA